MFTQFEPETLTLPIQYAEKPIPLCVPEIRGNEWAYVKECLDTGWVSSVGGFVDRFEEALAAYVGVDYGVATVNGTAALHTALLVAGVEPGDEVLTSAVTFIAPANAIRYVGAWPVFIDAHADSWQMDPAGVAEFIETHCHWQDGALRNRSSGRRVRAILPVHILGHPVDMDPILAIARQYGLPVIEDATESLGARYKGRTVGALGDVACLSFNGNKLLTTGGGGMIITTRADWAKRARYLTTQAKDDPLEYIHGEIGYNYRLTNVQAALGCAQLEQINSFLEAKRQIADVYETMLGQFPGIQPMPEMAWAESVYWLYTVLLPQESRALLRFLQAAGIQTRPLWQPLHRSPAHIHDGRPLPVADDLYRRGLSLPCSVGLPLQDVEYVAARIVDWAQTEGRNHGNHH